MIVRYFFFFIILTFYACSSNENVLLELALDNSGENRSELEAVLDHYKDNQKKQEAARFLISNMIGKQVLDSNSVKGNHVYFDAFANYRETYGSFLYDIQYAIYDSINKLYSYTKVNPRFLSDLKELSSDYLIHHIDQCFQNKERVRIWTGIFSLIMYSLTLQIIVIGNMLGVILIENMLHYEILCICVRMKKLVKLYRMR